MVATAVSWSSGSVTVAALCSWRSSGDMNSRSEPGTITDSAVGSPHAAEGGTTPFCAASPAPVVVGAGWLSPSGGADGEGEGEGEGGAVT
jgi:hypothetical protein